MNPIPFHFSCLWKGGIKCLTYSNHIQSMLNTKSLKDKQQEGLENHLSHSRKLEIEMKTCGFHTYNGAYGRKRM